MLSHFRSFAVSAITLLTAATASHATDCDLGHDFGPEILSVKQSLSSGNYKQLFEGMSQAYKKELPFAVDTVEATLRSVSAEGFQYCKPILTTSHSPDFISEVTIFYTPDDNHIFMYIDAIKMNKGWRVFRLQMTTSPDELADLIIR